MFIQKTNALSNQTNEIKMALRPTETISSRVKVYVMMFFVGILLGMFVSGLSWDLNLASRISLGVGIVGMSMLAALGMTTAIERDLMRDINNKSQQEFEMQELGKAMSS